MKPMTINILSAALLACVAACGGHDAGPSALDEAGPEAPLTHAAPDGCALIDSRDWTAWVDRMPGPDAQPSLHVTGEIDLPTPGYSIAWQVGPADRMNPPAQFLELVLTPPDGLVAQVVTTEPVHYSGPAVYPEYRAIRVRCGDSQVADITEISETH